MVEPISEPVVMADSVVSVPAALSPAAMLLCEGLAGRGDKFALRLRRCQSEFSEENVHDLRVSTRRLMAILAMCRAVLPDLKTKSLRRELKFHLDSLDGLRDAQVMLLFMRKHFRRQAAAAPLIAFLNMQETHLIRQVGYEISLINPESVVERISALRTLMERSLTGTGVQGQILATVDETYAEVQWRRINVNPDDPSTIHAMRIAYKKFRYMVEIAGPLTPAMPPTRPQTMQRYQAVMGDIQDLVVFRRTVDRFESENPSFDMAPVRVFIIERCSQRVDVFMARMNRLDRFWRKNPSARFPWKPPARVEGPALIMDTEED